MSLSSLTDLPFLLGWLTDLAQKIPIYQFAFLGSVLEEVIAIIPSPFVMLTVGLNISKQPFDVVTFFTVSLVGALGKSIGASLFYFIADKGEDVVLGRFGKYLGVSHKQVEHIGDMISHRGSAEGVFFFLRAFPLIPSTPVSLFAGAVKIPFKLFFSLTLVGFWIRDMVLLWIGYSSPNAIEEISKTLDQLDSVFKYGIVAVALIGAYILYKKRKKLFEPEG